MRTQFQSFFSQEGSLVDLAHADLSLTTSSASVPAYTILFVCFALLVFIFAYCEVTGQPAPAPEPAARFRHPRFSPDSALAGCMTLSK